MMAQRMLAAAGADLPAQTLVVDEATDVVREPLLRAGEKPEPSIAQQPVRIDVQADDGHLEHPRLNERVRESLGMARVHEHTRVCERVVDLVLRTRSE